MLDATDADDDGAPPASEALPVLLLCCAIGALCALDRVVMSVAILPMSIEMGYSDATKGLIAAGFSIGYGIALLPAGLAASRLAPKPVLAAGLLVWSAAQAASPAAASAGLPSLLAARAVMGAGEAAAIPSLQAVAAKFVPAESRSRFWGCLTASLSLGTISAFVVTPPLLAERGWPFVFEAYGAAGLVLAAAWAAFGASSPSGGGVEQCVVVDTGVVVDSCDGSGVVGAANSEDSVPWRAIASSPPVWALAAAHSASNFFMYFGLSWLPSYYALTFGLSTEAASAASLTPYAAGAVGALAAGTACDALVGRGVPLTDARKLMQSVALLGPAAAMLALSALGSGVGGVQLERPAAESLFVFGVACQSFCAAGFGCGAQDISSRYSSLIYGATSVVAVACGAAGQVFTGWLLEANGRDFGPMFAVTALVQLAGLAVWLSCWESERAFE